MRGLVYIFVLLLEISGALSLYTEEPPVKLLEVESLAERFPATESQYRVSVEDGFDEDAHRTETEALNGFPEMRLILNPGGCAVYVLPVTSNQKYLMIHPARKAGDPYENYCPKAKVEVEVSTNDNQTMFYCFTEPDDCHSSACIGNFESVLAEETSEVQMSLCTQEEDTNTASIWEINISESNDSSKIQGVFMEGAKERFYLAQSIPEFNKQLTLVSIVGARGVGKSTVTSLLSGNHSMFTTGSGSVGTTTTGADMSTIIPTTEYADILGDNLGIALNIVTEETLPLFLIDSEGMGVRGDAFDFITTSPPAVIAKVVIWIGAENLQTVEILYKINEYLNGLDNIIMDDGEEEELREETFCNSPNYGHFVVVINKMMGDASDEQLYMELMTPEPDYISGSQERNDIRTKLLQCFDGLSVHGLPVLTVEPGQEIDYPILTERFKASLAAMANTILEKSPTPRNVSVGGVELELNSTTAEVIISTVIEEANEGKIDLTGFQSFWKIITWRVDDEMSQSQKSLDISAPMCDQSEGFVCSRCVCAFRNQVVEFTRSKIDQIFSMAAQEALDLFGEDVTDEIADKFAEDIDPWSAENSCSNVKPFHILKQDLCDFSEMESLLSNPNNDIHITCSYGFLCDTITIEASNITIDIENIFFHSQDTRIVILPPSKASNGAAGENAGDDGFDGEDGRNGTNLYIHSSHLMISSETSFILTSYGGEGGDGGDGAPGLAGRDGSPGRNGTVGQKGETGLSGPDYISDVILDPANPEYTNADQIIAYGTPDGGEQKSCWEHCICFCEECTWRQPFKLEQIANVKGQPGFQGFRGGNGTDGEDGEDGFDGGRGGRGGDGGSGGVAGSVFVSGVDLKPVVNNIGGNPGLAGKGGVGGRGGAGGVAGTGGAGGPGGDGGRGGRGRHQQRVYHAVRRRFRDCVCKWNACHEDSTKEYHEGFAKEFYSTEGNYGDDGPEGPRGYAGSGGHPGIRGVDGMPGSDGEAPTV